MTLGALVDAGADLATIQAGIASLGLPGVRLAASEVKKKGFRATQITVVHEPEHKHRHLHHITAMIDGSVLTARQKELATRIFTRLAEAEAKVHGTTIQKVHFHEVGAVDSIADIVGSAIGWDLLGVERIIASPVPTGSGFIEIAHGRCSVPAPAVGELLRGVPLAESSVPFELTTPTGAAILAALADGYRPAAGDDDRADRLRSRLARFGGAGQFAAPAGGPSAAEHVGRDQVTLSGNESGRYQRRTGGPCHRPIVGGRSPGCLHQSDRDEKEPAGRAAERALPTGRRRSRWRRFCFAKRRRSACGDRLCRGGRYAASRTRWPPPGGRWPACWPGSTTRTARFSPEFESCRQLAESQNLPLAEVYEAARQAYQSRRQPRGRVRRKLKRRHDAGGDFGSRPFWPCWDCCCCGSPSRGMGRRRTKSSQPETGFAAARRPARRQSIRISTLPRRSPRWEVAMHETARDLMGRLGHEDRDRRAVGSRSQSGRRPARSAAARRSRGQWPPPGGGSPAAGATGSELPTRSMPADAVIVSGRAFCQGSNKALAASSPTAGAWQAKSWHR